MTLPCFLTALQQVSQIFIAISVHPLTVFKHFGEEFFFRDTEKFSAVAAEFRVGLEPAALHLGVGGAVNAYFGGYVAGIQPSFPALDFQPGNRIHVNPPYVKCFVYYSRM